MGFPIYNVSPFQGGQGLDTAFLYVLLERLDNLTTSRINLLDSRQKKCRGHTRSVLHKGLHSLKLANGIRLATLQIPLEDNELEVSP